MSSLLSHKSPDSIKWRSKRSTPAGVTEFLMRSVGLYLTRDVTKNLSVTICQIAEDTAQALASQAKSADSLDWIAWHFKRLGKVEGKGKLIWVQTFGSPCVVFQYCPFSGASEAPWCRTMELLWGRERQAVGPVRHVTSFGLARNSISSRLIS